jgi:hypothetical protein
MFEHRRTMYCFVVAAPGVERLCTSPIKIKTASVW